MSLCLPWGVSRSPVVISVMAALTRTVPLVTGLIFLLQPAQLYGVGLVVTSLGAPVCIIFEKSVFIFQFLNDEMQNYVKHNCFSLKN